MTRRTKNCRRCRALKVGSSFVLGLLGIGTVLQARPGWAFAQVASLGNLHLHHTRVASPPAFAILSRVEAKVARARLPKPRRPYSIYLCDDDWRWDFFSRGNGNSAAVARTLFVSDVVVRAGDFVSNRYLQANHDWAPAERTLDYLLTHELTHLVLVDHVGNSAAARLPDWVREGYADYIGRGRDFDYDDALRAFVGAARTRNPPQTGRYLGYALAVAQLLEQEGWSVDELLRSPPARAQVEGSLRARASAHIDK